MTEKLSFTIAFDKFSRSREVRLAPGLHVIYGGSGVGKTAFIRQLCLKTASGAIPRSAPRIGQRPTPRAAWKKLGAARNAFETAPKKLGAVPEKFENNPKAFGSAPREFGTAPKVFETAPQTFGPAPIEFGANFSIRKIRRPAAVQIVFQNPENQIVSPTLEGELAFSLECRETDPAVLKRQVQALQAQLPFSADRERHPASLSGGEKEILNLVTAFSPPVELILIDDGLSFLNRDTKLAMLDFIRSAIARENLIVLWFSSDKSDLEWGDSSWELTLDAFNTTAAGTPQEYPPTRLTPGRLEVSCRGLHFAYDSKPLFQNLHLAHTGLRCLGLVGANGSGKTTLAKLLMGLLSPTGGSIRLSLGTPSPAVAYLDQFPERTLGTESLGSLVEALEREGKLKPQAKQSCLRALHRQQVPWEQLQDRQALDIPWTTLRLALIIILAHCHYDLLILDEPTFGLGWEQKLNLRAFLNAYLRRRHLLLISHDWEFVQGLCDQVYHLDQERIIKGGGILVGE